MVSALNSGETQFLRELTDFRYSAIPAAGAEEPQSLKEENEAPHLILLEKYGCGTYKRYVVESDSQIRTVLEERFPETNVVRDSHTSETNTDLSWIPKVVKDFILSAGFPGCWSRLIFGNNTAASAAAIRWVSKDCIGAVGGLFIGLVISYKSQEKFGNVFDDGPKQWRLYADFVGSTGSIFDLSTQLYPAYFLPLASLGNLARAVGRGLRDPSFRAIPSHVAISGNLGDVSAKEEVWEVAAELVGLALGILALLLHLWFRYLSLSVLRFNVIKRFCILVNSHILYQRVPEIRDLVWERFLKPKITSGVSLEEMVTTGKKHGPTNLLPKV